MKIPCIILISIYMPLTSIATETAKVLPKGISRARLVGAYLSPVDRGFNQNERVEFKTHNLNRSLNLQNLASSNAALEPLVQALDALDPGLQQQLLSINLFSDFNVDVTQYTPAFEYGLSNKVSVGIRVPIIKRNASASFNINNVNNASQIAAELGSLSGVSEGLRELALANLSSSIAAAMFTDKGYVIPQSFSKTEIGDVEIGAKYNFYNKSGLYLTNLSGFKLPTGSKPDISNVFDTGSGEGSLAVGTKLIEQYFFNDTFSIGASQKITYYVDDRAQRAVPKNANDPLPSLLPKDGQVESVTRHRPIQFIADVGAEASFLNNTYKLWSGVEYKTAGRQSYSGPSNLYYEGLAENTEYWATSAELGFGYSTIPMFRNKKFAVPLEIQAMYSSTLAGKNTNVIDYTRIDLIVYF